MKIGIQNVQVIGNELAIIWTDAKESYYPLESLRRHCPCAACGGEPDVMGTIVKPHVSYGEKSFFIRGINHVGGYALQIEWEDGHNTGLFSYSYLQKWESMIRSGQG